MTEQAERERREIAFWRESEDERPGAFGLDLLTHKMSEARIFLARFAGHSDLFERASTIVELGGGQLWTSCMVKHEVGTSATVIGTDIAPDAVVSSPQWSGVVGAAPDARLACRSSAVPLADASVDLVFCFAAAHHFGDQRATLQEVARILRPGGHALYLYEPGVRELLYPLALRRVMAKRPVVPEDLIKYRELARMAPECGLDLEVQFVPSTTYRGSVETVYYLALSKLRPLQRVLPCTVDLVFTRRGGPVRDERSPVRE
ncbi:MAG: class I SAM-dependent methyltransferase [Acidimicrobiia bacterium]